MVFWVSKVKVNLLLTDDKSMLAACIPSYSVCAMVSVFDQLSHHREFGNIREHPCELLPEVTLHGRDFSQRSMITRRN
jgi:hypothetical protein